MNNNFKCTLTDKGVAIQGEAVNLNGERYKFGFLVSLEETEANWDDAKKWCEEQGGHLPSLEQARIIAEYQKDINALLNEAGKECLGGYIWTDKIDWDNSGYAWYVGIDTGSVSYDDKYDAGYVRAVSAFPIE